jgi:uroporphyrinogen decarboxylase
MFGQAGSYLPEFREILAGASYRELVETPDLSADATMQPIRRFGLDAAPLVTEPMLFLEPVGARVEFAQNMPRVAQPIRSRNELERLSFRPGAGQEVQFLGPAARAAAQLLGDVPLIAVSNGPYTLAATLIDGYATGDGAGAKAFLYNDPSAAGRLIEHLAELVIEAVSCQIEHGARAFVIIESAAGALSSRDFRSSALGPLTEVFRRLQSHRVPGTIFVPGGEHLLDLLLRVGPHVLAVDWRQDLERIRTRLPENVTIQGNLDPAVLLGPADRIRDRATDVLIQGTLYRGHVFSLGGAVDPHTAPESVQAVMDIVRDFDPNLEGWRSLRP